MKKVVKRTRRTCLIIICVFLLLPFPFSVIAAPGYDGTSEGRVTGREAKRWVNHNSDQYQSIYGENAQVGSGRENLSGDVKADTGFLSGVFGEFFGDVANTLYDLFNTANIDLTIDGIVYGRVKPTTTLSHVDGQWVNMQMNLLHFGLEKNNAWGIFGATLYYVLRNRFAFIAIPAVGIIMLGIEAFKGGEKGRAGVERVMGKLVAFFVIMYAVPYILEAYIYLRDVLMVVVRDGLSNPLQGLNGSVTGTAGIYSNIRSSWEKMGHPFLLGLILLGYSCAGLVYFWDYIRIALMVAAVFGLLPFILIWWFFKPKILTDWLNLVLPSLLTPFIDMILLLAPCFVIAIFNRVFSSTSNIGVSVILALAILACMWAMRPVRDRILKLFGFEGVRGGSSGLGLALAMLSRNFGAGGHRGGEVGGRESGGEGRDSASHAAEQMRETNEVLENADRAIAEINSDDYTSDFSVSDEAGDWVREMNEESRGLVEEDVDTDGEVASSEDRAVNEDVMSESELSDMDMDGESSGDMGDAVKAETSYAEEALESASDVVETTAEGARKVGEGVETVAEGVSRIDAHGSEENASAGKVELGELSMEGAGVDRSAMGNSVAAARAELPVSVLSADQNKYVNSLSDRDKKRFSNLQQMDALESGIAKNERIMADSGYSRGAYDTAISKGNELATRMKSLNVEKSSLENRLVSLDNEKSSGSISADEYSRRKDVITTEQQRNLNSINEVAAAQKANNAYMESMKTSYMAERQNVAYKQELDARRGVESQYAHNSGLAGMSTKSYSNASDFLHQKRVDDIKKKHVNYTNFDTKQYDSILSPSEREELYRKRATRMAIDRVERAIENVASVGVGTVAAATAMFAGSGAMAGAAIAGSNVGRKTVQTAESMVEETVKVVDVAGKKLYATVDTRSVGGAVNNSTVKTESRNGQAQSVGNEGTHGSRSTSEGTVKEGVNGDRGEAIIKREMNKAKKAAEKYKDKL